MAVKIRCSECRKKISVDEAFSGSMCRCPYCKSIVMVPKLAPAGAATPRPASPGKGRAMRPRTPQGRSQTTGGSGLENVVGSRPIIDITRTEPRRTRRRGVTPIASPGRPQIPGDLTKAVADARAQAAQAADEARAAESQANAEAAAREKAQAQAKTAREEAQRKAAEARTRAKQLEQAKQQASAEARQAADAKARQAAEAERRAQDEANARRQAEESARKAAEEAEKRIRQIEQQAAKLVADAQQRARQQVEEAHRAAGHRQKELQAELEALKAAAAGQSDEQARQAGESAAEAQAQKSQAELEAQANAAADDAAAMIQKQLDKLRQAANQAKQQAAQAQAAREAAEQQASQARQEAQRAAAEAGAETGADSARAARDAMQAAKRAAREADEATKAAAEHAAKEQAARQKAQAGAQRAAEAEAAAREYEASATDPPHDEDIPEAPVVDESKLTPEQLAAIPQASPVFFQGMVTLVLIVVLIFMTIACVYLGAKLMETPDAPNENIYATEEQQQQAQAPTLGNPFQTSTAGPRVAGDVAIDAPVIFLSDAGTAMGEHLNFVQEMVNASAKSLPAGSQATMIIAREDGPETIGPMDAGELPDAIEMPIATGAFGATNPEDAIDDALKLNPKTVVLFVRNKDLNGQTEAIARKVSNAGAKLVIVMTGFQFSQQKEAIQTAVDAGATVRVYDERQMREFWEAAGN